MRFLSILIPAISLMLIVSPALADKVYLNNGETVEGSIIDKNQNFIKLKEKSGVVRQFFKFQYKSFEEDLNKPTATTASAPATGQMTAEKRVLINQVITLTGMKKNIESNVQQIIDKAPLEQRQKLREIFVVEEIVDTIVPLYAKYYSESELKNLIVFYQSPTGKKVLEVTPQISHDAMNATLDYFQKKVKR